MPSALGVTWVEEASTRDLLGWLGILSTLVFYVAPCKDYHLGEKSVRVSKTTLHIHSPMSQFVNFVACVLWSLWALQNLAEVYHIFLLNVTGGLITLSFLAVFAMHATPGDRRAFGWLSLLSSIVIALPIALGIVVHSWGVIGVAAAAANIGSCWAPLAEMRQAAEQGTLAHYPMAQVAVGVVSRVIWVLYAAYIANLYVFVPSLFAALLNVAQVVYYVRLTSAWCVRKEKVLPSGRVSLESQDASSGYTSLV